MFSRSSLLVSLVLILAIHGGILFFTGAKLDGPQFDTSKTLFFSSKTCTECRTTEKWLVDRAVTEKLSLRIKQAELPLAQAELQQAANYCKLDTSRGISLPFLFAEGKCYVGGVNIKDYFGQKLSIH